MLGFNLNQAQTPNAPVMTVVPSGAGIAIEVTKNTESPLRIQLQGPGAMADPEQRWCATLAGKGGFYPWSMFNTKCWDGTGTAYAKQPIEAAMVLVPGTTSAAVPFDFCVNSLAESDGTSAAGGGGPTAGAAGGGGPSSGAAGGAPVSSGSNSGSGMLSDRWGAAMVMRDGRSYFVQNNVWGDSSSQALSYEGTTFEITAQTGNNVPSGPDAMGPVSYPSVFIGSNNNRATQGSNLPKQVSALSSVKTGWSIDSGGAQGTWNAAYDVWFSTGAGGDPASPSGGYLMVWYVKPGDAQPIGSVVQPGVSIAGVEGSWDVWLGQNLGLPCISYVRTQAIQSMEFDLNAFILDAVERPGAIDRSWYLSNVFAGFEIWSGGVGLATTSFYAIVE
jgi:hypothetical protein